MKTAEELNARNQGMFDEAAQVLGDALFKEVFGFEPTDKINLIDPRIMEQKRPTNVEKNLNVG
jgi:hypothetical protein